MSGDRRSVRLPDVDYGRDGLYYVTFCTFDRRCLFGDIVKGEMRLSPTGQIVHEEWLKTPAIRPGVTLDEFAIMPDHFHALIQINQPKHQTKKEESGETNGGVGAHRSAPCPGEGDRCEVRSPLRREPRTLGSLIAQFKAVTTHRINNLLNTPNQKIWQRGFHDRILRTDYEADKIRKYIRNNARHG